MPMHPPTITPATGVIVATIYAVHLLLWRLLTGTFSPGYALLSSLAPMKAMRVCTATISSS